MLLLTFLALAVSSYAQPQLQYNGYTLFLPAYQEFNYFQGGADWAGDCQSPVYPQSAIDINETSPMFQVVTGSNSTFNPVLVQNAPIGNNFITRNVEGNINHYVFAGFAYWTIPNYNRRDVLVEFHMVAPAENLFNGYQYPLELHMYYGIPRPGDYLQNVNVIAIWFEEGEQRSPFLDQMISNSDYDVRSLFPDSGVLDDYYFYVGTEDKPFGTCYLNLGWLIPGYVLSASADQIDYFNNMYMNNASFAGGRGNNRILQETRNIVYHFISNQPAGVGFFLE